MLEQLLSWENLLEAFRSVEANKGSHGVDGMSINRQAIEEGTYQPSPVRQVEKRNRMADALGC